MNILGFEYIEFVLDDLRCFSDILQTVFGFKKIAVSDEQDEQSVLFLHGPIKIILTKPFSSAVPSMAFLKRHGPGVMDIGFKVDDLNQININRGSFFARYQVYDDLYHTFVESDEYLNKRFHHFENSIVPSFLIKIDHLAFCIPRGEMLLWENFYQEKLHFRILHREQISTSESGMDSVALASYNNQVKIVLTESIVHKKSSQVDDFIKSFNGAGVQHMAFAVEDIVKVSSRVNNSLVPLLEIPDSYYETLALNPRLDISNLKENHILVEVDDKKELYQAFTKPAFKDFYFFFELIQRNSHDGFGANNILALFKAIVGQKFIL
jgi:4-hydroxymandelate synthase